VPSGRIVAFGVFEFDLETGELQSRGHNVRLQEQPRQVLRMLVARPGELITREALKKGVWPDETFVDFEAGLNVVVNKLRHVLRDSAASPRFIETVPRRGYRFIAPLTALPIVDAAAEHPDSVANLQRASGGRFIGPLETELDNGSPVVGPLPVPHSGASRRFSFRRPWHISDVRVALQGIKEDSESGSAAAVPTSRQYRGVMIAAFIGVVSVLAAMTWLLRSPHGTEAPPPRVLPLTTFPGFERDPALSPDGNQVAFAWSGEKNDNWDVYLKFVGSSEMRRLTTDPLNDVSPRWSPDGRYLAFKRCQPETKNAPTSAPYRPLGCQLRRISAMGGTDSKISDFRFASGQLDWSADGRFIVAGISQSLARQQPAGLYLLPVAGGTPRRLTTPKVVTDQAPAFSRDGRRLAYASCSGDISVSDCDVYVLDLDTAFTPVGQARRLTSHVAAISGLTWSRNGQSIIYDAPTQGYLWSVDVGGHDQPVRLELPGVLASAPATTSAMDRLVFSLSLLNWDVYEIAWGHPPQPLAASSLNELLAKFSPDGRQIVFCSARSSGDSFELWIASADGSGARQLTRGIGRGQCGGSWSPHGQQIAFDSVGEDGRYHIWLIDPDGGTPRQVTTDPGSQRGPSWSHDGQWIYYWLQQSTHSDVWRTRLSDGVKEQLTHDGKTLFGVELFGGSHFLYQTESGSLMEAPLQGGSTRQLVKCALFAAFAASSRGIYYAGCEPRSDPPVYLLNPVTGKQRLLGQLEKPTQSIPITPLGVSPDGTRVLYTRDVSNGADLMLIENFR
jgi:Tol biopolymer transport system component/DNA-binding winged helix-turn-helix (wHTH) protein